MWRDGVRSYRLTMSNKTPIVVAMLAAGAIAAPSAAARPADFPAPVTTPHAEVGKTYATAAHRGFEWEDAGLGAAGTLFVLGLGTGAVVVRRRPDRVGSG